MVDKVIEGVFLGLFLAIIFFGAFSYGEYKGGKGILEDCFDGKRYVVRDIIIKCVEGKQND